jgi:LacI family transcriptional regulator
MEFTHSVALVVETSRRFGRQMLKGIGRYLRTHANWDTYVAAQPRKHFPSGLGNWKGDGVIATIDSEEIEEQYLSLGVPVINVSGHHRLARTPSVICQDHAVGRLGADHFIERGFSHCAYFGLPESWYSQRRGEGFAQSVRDEGREPIIYDHPPLEKEDWPRWRADARDWLAELPRPVGILACDDNQGRTLLAVCREMGLRVPEDVAILGVDNDDVLCELCTPPLSSIENAGETRGFEAAALLDKLLAGQPNPTRPVEIPPQCVVARQSTDVIELEDSAVAAALRYIRSHAHKPIGVPDLLEVAPVSRKSLEIRFSKALGRSPGVVIRQAHLQRAKTLLTETDYPLAEVAARSGLSSAKTLCDLFRRYENMTPTQYRRTFVVR